MDKLKNIFKKIVNKETILYIVFGVLTTLVNFVSFKLLLFSRALTFFSGESTTLFQIQLRGLLPLPLPM